MALVFVCGDFVSSFFFFFFFFKQKTAYEIGTGDWSSDVCSSDLTKRPEPCTRSPHQAPGRLGIDVADLAHASLDGTQDRKSVV